jgi:hypothetical protein
MAEKQKKGQVTAYFSIVLEVGMKMSAATLEDAVRDAQALGVVDVVDLKGLDYNDGSIKVTGVYVDL